MITRIGQLLEQLYAATSTPRKSQDYLANPNIISYIQRVFNIIGKEHNSYNILDIEVESIVLFLLDLMSVRMCLEGILLVKMPVVYMTDKAMVQLKAEEQDIQAMRVIRDTWQNVLDKEAKNVKKFFLHRPDYEVCPLLTFHADAYKSSLLSDHTAPLYEAYAFGLHLDIRFNQFQMGIDPDTHLTYVRPARYFFEYISDGIKQRRDHPLDHITREYLNDFMANRLKRDEIALKTVETDLAHFTALKKRKEIKPHPRISGKTSHNRKIRAAYGSSDRDESGNATPQQFSIHGLTLEPPPDVHALLDFVEKIDHSYATVPRELLSSKSQDKSIRYKRYMDYLHVRNFIFHWDMQYLSLFHFAILYNALEEARTGSNQLKAIALFLYFLIHTGIDHEELLETTPILDDLATDAIGIKKIEGRYYLLNPSLIQPQHNPGCQQTLTHVHIPLPTFLADMLPDDVLSRTHLFSFMQGTREIHLTSYDIKSFLSKVSKAFAVYDLTITIGQIEKSFLPLYCSRYGLDPMLCCHISGKDRHKLYGSQLHYIYIPPQLLESRYLETFSVVHHEILRNLNACVDHGLIYCQKIAVQPPIATIGFKSPVSAGYSSSSTPVLATIQALIGNLKAAIQNQTKIVSRHNLFICYLFFAIQFSTGHRPSGNLSIPRRLYNDKSGVLLIIEKDSAEYYEQRLLPLTSVAKSLMVSLQKGIPTLDDFVVRNLLFSDQSGMFDNFLFFVNDHGRYVDFTPEKLFQTLQSARIEYPFPMNMPRHYLRNHLYHTGISNDLADAWLGHQRDGRELLNIASSTIVSTSLLKCLSIVEDMLAEIGFSNIEYQRS